MSFGKRFQAGALLAPEINSLPMKPQNMAREKRSEDVGEGNGSHESGNSFGPIFVAEPMREIDN
jgi:hypothetical protein